MFCFVLFPLLGGRAELGFGAEDRASGQAFASLKRPRALLLRTLAQITLSSAFFQRLFNPARGKSGWSPAKALGLSAPQA